MAGRCPHLGLTGNRNQVFVVSSSRHRCYLRGRGERIGSAHQAGICLTSSFPRCLRLTADTAQLAAGSHVRDQAPFQVEQPAPSELAWTRPVVRYTDLQVAPRRRKKARRSMTSTEMLVWALSAAIFLAACFIGTIVVYRIRVGPGMAAAPVLAEGSEPATAGVIPTLVPTFTPTPTASPTAPAPTAVMGPPTPIPEPTLPMPTPVLRPPADSPPSRLVIAKIALDIPVRPVGVRTLLDQGNPKLVWADVPSAGGFHQTSAYPGRPGNTVINGHRDIQGSVFRHLDQIEVGDEIIVYVGETAYPYYVTETLVVQEAFASAEQRAENQRLIGYMPEERLTLITCTPVGLATHRLLVIAKPPEPGLYAQP